MSDQPSLYERLGGINAIAAVVDDFVDRIQKNHVLRKNPDIVAGYDNMTTAGLKYMVTEMVSWAAGGPQTYTGRTMAESHDHLNSSNEDWDAFVSEFQKSMDKFNVPSGEQAELVAIVNSTKADIVK